MNWLLMLIGLSLTFYFIFKIWEKESGNDKLKRVFLPALLFKILGGLAAGLIYFYFYEGKGDTILFFDTSWSIAQNIIQNPFHFFSSFLFNQNNENVLLNFNGRTAFFIGFLVIPVLFSGGIYWVCTLYVSLISFLVAWYLVKVITSTYQNEEIFKASIVAFLFIPSVAIWTSGIFKENLSTSAIFVLIATVIQISKTKRVKLRSVFLLIVSAGILIGVKYYLAAMILPIAGISLYSRRRMNRRSAVLGFFFLALIFLVSNHPNLDISLLPEIVTREYDWKMTEGNSEQYVLYTKLDSSWFGLMASAPRALLVGLFMPLDFTLSNPLKFALSCEHLIVILIFLIAVSELFRNKMTIASAEVAGLLSYIILASILLSLTSPNIGTLSRYKVAYSPFFLFLNLILFFRAKNRLRSNDA